MKTHTVLSSPSGDLRSAKSIIVAWIAMLKGRVDKVFVNFGEQIYILCNLSCLPIEIDDPIDPLRNICGSRTLQVRIQNVIKFKFMFPEYMFLAIDKLDRTWSSLLTKKWSTPDSFRTTATRSPT